jgi:hypothetical protein
MRILLAMSCAALSLGSIPVQAQPGGPDFGVLVNRCLSLPHASIIDCARDAALATGSVRLNFDYDIDLATAQPRPAGFEVADCKDLGGGLISCNIYECGERDGNQSYCDLVNVCVENESFSACTD